MSYLISAVAIRDYKRIHEVQISPDANSVLLLIGGENAQGKTSVLDALEAALGGKEAVLSDPVRHGAESAEIRVTLSPDDGSPPLTARRRVSSDGASTLELRDDLGAVKSPQALLDKIIGARFLDPLKWLKLDAGDQRKRLLELVDRDGEIAKLDARHDRLYARRTEIAREVKRTAGALASAGDPADPPAPIDVAELSAELQQVGDQIREVERATSRREMTSGLVSRTAAAVQAAHEALERAQAELARAERAHAEAREKELQAISEIPALHRPRLDQRRAEIQAEIGRAAAHNATVSKAQAAVARRAELAAEHDSARAAHAQIEADMAAIDEAKRARLAAAALPVEGLGITEQGVTYRGALLANASGAQRMQVAIALAAAAQPQLRDVWIRDGAIISEQSLIEIAAMARAAGIRVWVERVETRDPGVIEIRDGRVAEPAPLPQGRLFE